MKLQNREPVVGTVPTIYIGHRINKDPKTGNLRVSTKWHCEYNSNGKRFHEPLKTTHKAKAISAAHGIAARLERGEQRSVQRRIEWKEFVEQYLMVVRSMGRAPKTVEKYTLICSCLVEYAKEQHRKHGKCARPDLFTAADFWGFNLKLTGEKYHGKTRMGWLLFVKQLFKWASKSKPKLLLENPIADEVVEEFESSPQPCFTPEQVAMLLEKANAHEGAIYAVLAYLGLRIGEATELMWSDFGFDLGMFGKVWIRRGGSDMRTKNGTSRMIPVNEELRKILDRQPRHPDGRVFHQRPSKKYPSGDRPLSERRLLRSLKRLCKRCGFDNPKQYKLHTFRHAFASMLARANVPYQHALEFMGHDDSDILKMYIKMFDKDADRHIASIVYTLEIPVAVPA